VACSAATFSAPPGGKPRRSCFGPRGGKYAPVIGTAGSPSPMRSTALRRATGRSCCRSTPSPSSRGPTRRPSPSRPSPPTARRPGGSTAASPRHASIPSRPPSRSPRSPSRRPRGRPARRPFSMRWPRPRGPAPTTRRVTLWIAFRSARSRAATRSWRPTAISSSYRAASPSLGPVASSFAGRRSSPPGRCPATGPSRSPGPPPTSSSAPAPG
jgi:hypothetical protein